MPRDGDDPCVLSELMLMQPKNLAKSAAKSIPLDGRANTFRRDKPDAQRGVGGGLENGKHQQLRMLGDSFFANLTKFTRKSKPTGFGK